MHLLINTRYKCYIIFILDCIFLCIYGSFKIQKIHLRVQNVENNI